MSIDDLVNKAARELRHGYHIEIWIENGFAEASLLDSESNILYKTESDNTIEHCILECIHASREQAQP